LTGKPTKTQKTDVSVSDFLGGVAPDARRADAETLCEVMTRLSGEPARMWGPSIVGFGVRRYRYPSGREGEICRIGFSPRKAAVVLYISADIERDPDVQALGKVTMGKSCFYVKSLKDVDLGRLEALIERGLTRDKTREAED